MASTLPATRRYQNFSPSSGQKQASGKKVVSNSVAQGGSQPKSTRAGLQFPVARVHRLFRKANYANRVNAGAAVYMTAVITALLNSVIRSNCWQWCLVGLLFSPITIVDAAENNVAKIGQFDFTKETWFWCAIHHRCWNNDVACLRRRATLRRSCTKERDREPIVVVEGNRKQWWETKRDPEVVPRRTAKTPETTKRPKSKKKTKTLSPGKKTAVANEVTREEVLGNKATKEEVEEISQEEKERETSSC
ncbi:histone H2A-beta, sperm [Ditylenchus destructor]|nr:histone H2A-beta, sperm [Ditylenchus destructor]